MEWGEGGRGRASGCVAGGNENRRERSESGEDEGGCGYRVNQ